MTSHVLDRDVGMPWGKFGAPKRDIKPKRDISKWDRVVSISNLYVISLLAKLYINIKLLRSDYFLLYV